MKKMTILGAGKSGVAAARLAKRSGDKPFLSEYAETDISFLKNELIPFETGGHTNKAFDCDFLVLSPGIKKEWPIVQRFLEKKISVISEIEYASSKTSQPFIGITGSNGKTTTTTLIGRMLEEEWGGKRTAGNIGIPLSDVVDADDTHPIAVELSSFQLETIETFSPKTALLLNVSPNHLDWYDSYEHYIDAKCLLLKNHHNIEQVVVNADDKELMRRTETLANKRLTFSLQFPEATMFANSEGILYNGNDRIKLVDCKKLKLKGPHHLMNMMAAALAALSNGVTIETIRTVLYQFDGLEHRMETVATVNGKTFVNDSKSTSIEALKMALQSYEKPVILLAGGKHKGASYSVLSDLIKERTKKVYVFGQAATQMYDEWHRSSEIIKVATMFEAIEDLCKLDTDELVLLSPACSSFDQFKSFEDRGDQFKNYINQLRIKN